MGLFSDTIKKKEEDEDKKFSPNDMYDMGEDDDPSILEMFAKWSNHKINKGRRQLAEVR